MNETLSLLYDRFYTSLPMAESEQEVETCHRQLIERLDKPERKLVLRIIDAQNLMIEQRSVDSFIYVFCPAINNMLKLVVKLPILRYTK